MSDTANTIVGFIIILVVLPVFILLVRDCTKRASAMQYSLTQTIGLVISCVLGGLFIIIGGVNFRTEQSQTSIHPVADFVFNVAFIIVGLLIWATAFLRYGGGFWFIAGAFLIAGAFSGTVSIFETHIRGGHYDSPVAFYARIASCWIVGGIFLLIGHRRHRRKNQVLPNTYQTAAANPADDRERK